MTFKEGLLEDAVALVTGGRTGSDAAIANGLSPLGAKVVAAAIVAVDGGYLAV